MTLCSRCKRRETAPGLRRGVEVNSLQWCRHCLDVQLAGKKRRKDKADSAKELRGLLGDIHRQGREYVKHRPKVVMELTPGEIEAMLRYKKQRDAGR